MSIYYGGNEYTKVYVGGNEQSKLQFGGNEVFTPVAADSPGTLTVAFGTVGNRRNGFVFTLTDPDGIDPDGNNNSTFLRLNRYSNTSLTGSATQLAATLMQRVDDNTYRYAQRLTINFRRSYLVEVFYTDDTSRVNYKIEYGFRSNNRYNIITAVRGPTTTILE